VAKIKKNFDAVRVIEKSSFCLNKQDVGIIINAFPKQHNCLRLVWFNDKLNYFVTTISLTEWFKKIQKNPFYFVS